MQALNPVAFATAILLFFVAVLMAPGVMAAQFTVNVVENDGVTPVNGFRWILQEDATFPVDPNNPGTTADELLSLNFHASYHPIAQNGGVGLSGDSATDSNSVTINAPNGRYYLSVLPYSGYSISGQPVELGGAGAPPTVTVIAQKHPIPTASIAMFFFQDHFPINGAPDLPEEANPTFLPDGTEVDWTQFNIQLEEPAGRYGIAGGQVIQDAFGNPLGTVYDRTCDETGANPGAGAYGCFDANGDPIVLTLGDGTLQPEADGTLLVRNLAPGKYGVIVIPPTGSNWQQTTTIEGTKVIDAWVKANEPAFFVEFGPPGPHVFFGFIKSSADGGFPALSAPPGTTVATVTGTITDMHMSRPPNFQFFSGRPFPGCWVGINQNVGGLPGPGIWAGPCDGDSNFEVAGLAPGDYQLKVFDANLDMVIATQGFTVDADLSGNATGHCNAGTAPGCDFGEVPVFNWFARLNTGIFNDIDQDGFWDPTEAGIGPESQDVSVRWRDGTIYQNFPTDGDGLAPFDEVFPFFHWLVAEVSFANKKATGATFVVDAGGPVDKTTDAFPGFGELTPQAQFQPDGVTALPDCDANPLAEACTTDGLSRTERGPVLTTGFQGFLGQTSVMHFGKTDYLGFSGTTYVGENGGISGIVYYATTRAEDEPQFAAAEEWEPGVPRVQVALYADGDIDSFPLGDFPGIGDVDWNGDGIRDLDNDIIDDVNGDGLVTLTDVDNPPLGNFPGLEDIDHNGNLAFDLGDAVQVTWTDSWDDSQPDGCQGVNNTPASTIAPPIADNRCFDGLRNFNQVRPGVFDGGYAFVDYDLGHLATVNLAAATAIQGFYNAINAAVDPSVAAKLQLGLIPGDYIVESATPPGYETLREEHKNVDFGDEYIPSAAAFAATCVGDGHIVPRYLQMQTVVDTTGLEPDGRIPVVDADILVDAPFAGETRPLCDRKKVNLSATQNAAAEFFLMTDVPVVANISGVTLNDLANEFNPNSPAFGEKYAPPLLPIAFYDFNGKLVNRIYGDANGRYNLVVPSTYTANLPQPSGMSPNMLLSCMNDAGPIDDGTGNMIIDPFFDPQYSQFCYTFQYMPGAITYLDTPVVSIAAFATPGAFPVDCERPTATPMIASVTRTSGQGNNIIEDGPYVLPGDDISIKSMGNNVSVPNPEWDGIDLARKNIDRDYRFAGNSIVELEAADGTRTVIPSSGNPNTITATVPTGTPVGNYQVVITNPGSGQSPDVESPIGVTLTVGDGTENVIRVAAAPYPATPIQDAIDLAAPGDLILLAPGSYDELVIMWKPVKLQGWGADAVILNARQVPTEKLQNWRDKASTLVSNFDIHLLPGQENLPGFGALAGAVFPTEEGAGILVAGLNPDDPLVDPNDLFASHNARIDGITIVGASDGGGIVVNGYNEGLSIGNNRLTANAGTFGGGIRVGHPTLVNEVGGLSYTDAMNDGVQVHHNHIAQNGGFGGAGGGLSLHTGADGYQVQNNWVCGNFTQGDGAGIGHLGLSDGGLIEDNIVIFNESFTQANAQAGGGIFVGGQVSVGASLLTPGSGSVTIDANLIRGNMAGAGDGGGLRLAAINGQDVEASPGDTGPWYQVEVFNNMITNNVAGLAGGGISLQDALKVSISNNTVANNESTATTAEAFSPGAPNETNPQPAGIVSREHSPDLAAVMALDVTAPVPADWLTFSDPELQNDIVYNNRSFYWANVDDPATPEIETGLYPASCVDPLTVTPDCDLANVSQYTDDLAVLDALVVTPNQLNPVTSLLTDPTGYDPSNVTGDPGFVLPYFNGSRSNLNIGEFTTLGTAAAFDEGGNFIQVLFGPLSLVEPDTNPNNNEGPLYDYHIEAPSAAINAGGNVTAMRLADDFDNDPRPNGGSNDIGADEAQ
jgi:hypothetical protein